MIFASSLTVNEVPSVPFIAINLLGLIINLPFPDIVKEAPFCKYIVPSFSFVAESVKKIIFKNTY